MSNRTVASYASFYRNDLYCILRVISIMVLEYVDVLFLGAWSFVGSVLGFFAFTNTHEKTPIERLKRCCLSIGIGMFLAFPITTYLLDTHQFSKTLSIMLGGLGAFGLPDFIIKYWPKLIAGLAEKVVDNASDNTSLHRYRAQYRQDNEDE